MSNNVGLKMLADGVLIKPGDELEKSHGIVLPDSAKQKPTIGTVVAVGPGAHNANGEVVKMMVKVGDTVYYKKWAGSEIKHNDVEYIVMKESDIIAIKEGK